MTQRHPRRRITADRKAQLSLLALARPNGPLSWPDAKAILRHLNTGPTTLTALLAVHYSLTPREVRSLRRDPIESGLLDLTDVSTRRLWLITRLAAGDPFRQWG